ncbi:MAG: hypothetical protein WC527_07920 [Candidatus Margulisiibacteriota bacterium]
MPRRNKRNKDDVEEMIETIQRETKNSLSEVEDEENYTYSEETLYNRMQRDDMFDENSFN